MATSRFRRPKEIDETKVKKIRSYVYEVED